MARRIEVELVGDSRQLERAFQRSERSARDFNRNVERAGRGALAASIRFTGLGRAAAFASGWFLGGAGIVEAARVGFDEMLRVEAVTASTAAALKTTGMVAGVTAGQINALAGSLQRMTGYDTNAIHSAENLMLAFTNVRNVAGRNNDVFNQAVTATLDLSRRFDRDLSTSAVQLGKALQNPVRGVTALRRAGVSFTSAQERTVRQLVSTGRVLEAQKLLLEGVRRAAGGAAQAYGKTLAGQLDILRGNLSGLAGELAITLSPEILKLTKRFNAWLENPENKKKIIDDWAASVHGLGLAFHGAGGIVKDFVGTWHELGSAFGPVWNVIQKLPGIDSGRFGRKGGGGVPPGLVGPRAAPSSLGGNARPPGSGAAAVLRPGASRTLRNRWFDAMIGRELVDVQDISTLKGQIDRLRVISGQVTARLAITKDITRKLTLEAQVKDIARTIRSDQADIAQKIADDAKEAADALEEARRAAVEESFGWLDLALARAETTKTIKDDLKAYADQEAAIRAQIRIQGKTLELETQLFNVQQQRADAVAKNAAERKQLADDLRKQAIDTQMGWLDFAIERAEATKTVKDDVQAYRKLEAVLVARIGQEGRTLELVRQLWETRQKIADLNKSKTDPLAGLVQVSSAKLTNILAAGTGLSGAGRRVLGANIAGAEIRPLHVHVNIDGREVGRAVTTQQARNGNRTARQTSGLRT